MSTKMSGTGRINRPFVGIPTFLRAPICLEPDEFVALTAALATR